MPSPIQPWNVSFLPLVSLQLLRNGDMLEIHSIVICQLLLQTAMLTKFAGSLFRRCSPSPGCCHSARHWILTRCPPWIFQNTTNTSLQRFHFYYGLGLSEVNCYAKEENRIENSRSFTQNNSISYSFQKDFHFSFKPILCSRVLIICWFHRN